MDEKELIDGLRGLTLSEPRLGFDPDEVAGRAAKRHRTQRQLLATAAGTLVIVGMAVGTLLYANAGDSLPLVPGGPTTVKTRPTTTTNPKKPDMTKQVARIRAHLEQTLPALIPDARDLRIEPVEQAYDRDYVVAVVEYQDADGPAGFNVSVLGPDITAENVFPFREKCICETPISQPDGSTLLVEQDNPNQADPPNNRDAAHYRADGTMVTIYNSKTYGVRQAERAGRKDAAGRGIPGRRTTFSLTKEQLITLVTDPALTVK